MRYFTFLYCLLLSSLVYAQCQHTRSGVLDAHVASERGPITTSGLYLHYNLAERLSHKKLSNDLVLSGEQKEAIESGPLSYSSFKPQYCYLFNEDDHWTARVFRTINLRDSANINITRGGFREMKFLEQDKSIRREEQWFPEQAFMSSFLNIVEKGYVTLYCDEHFNLLDSAERKLRMEKFDEVDQIIIKEDYYYSKRDRKVKSHIVGLGFLLKSSTNSDKSALFWTYYPELKWSTDNWMFQSPKHPWMRWSTYFEEHWYKTSKLEIYNHRNYTENMSVRPVYDDYNDYRNEIVAYAQVSIISDELRKAYSNETGIKLIPIFNDCTAEGEMVNGVPHGEWIVYHDEEECLNITFKNGIAHGSYKSFYEDGKLNQSGSFKYGLKEGKWQSFHENEVKMAARNYKLGWLDGEQHSWFDNNKSHLTYNYSNHQLNGSFERYNYVGILTEKGQFKNNYIDGLWEIKMVLSKDLKSILKENKNLDWGFPSKAAFDGTIEYNVEVEQYSDPKFCSFSTCVRYLTIDGFK